MSASVNGHDMEHVPCLKQEHHIVVCLDNLNRHRRVHRPSQTERQAMSRVVVLRWIVLLEDRSTFGREWKRSGTLLIRTIHFHICNERMVPHPVQIWFSVWKTRDRRLSISELPYKRQIH